MIAAAKAGDALGVAQHAAGIVPGASQVDQAMTAYQKQPSRENLAHIVTTALPFLVPGAVRLAGSGVDTLAAKLPGVTEGVEGAAPTATRNLIGAGQPRLQAAIRGTAEETANEAGVSEAERQGPQAQTAAKPSMRSVVENVAGDLKAKSQAAMRQLDAESGGRWQRFSDQIDNLNAKMDEINGIDDDKYEQFELKRNDIQTSQAQLLEDLQAKGLGKVPEQSIADYKQSMALKDVDQSINAATKGNVRFGTTEKVDPNMLVNRLEKLSKSGRLQQALPNGGADDFLQAAYKAQKTQANWTRAKWGAAVAAISIPGGGAIKHLWGLIP